MMELFSHIGGVVMLFGILVMALPVIRVASWGYTPLFEVGLGLFLLGLVAALAGAIGWVVGAAISFSLVRYPLSGG